MAITKPPVLPAWAESGDKVTPSNAEIQVGWPLSSIPPSRQRFNWLLNFLANGIRYFSRRGLPDYDAGETYMTGDRIIGDDGKTYRSLIDNNTAQTPSTSPTKWEEWAPTLSRFAALIQGQTYTAFTTAGAAPNFTLTPSPAIAAYAAGQRFRLKFHADGTGSDQLNISALGNKSVKQYDYTGTKVAAKIIANQLVDVEYDGVDFVMLDPLSGPRYVTNLLINAEMRFAQRKISAALTTVWAYCSVDRWMAIQSGTAQGTFSRVQAALPQFSYAAKLARNNGATSTGFLGMLQAMETANSVPIQGKKATVSFYAKAGTTYSGGLFNVNLWSGQGNDQAAGSYGSWTGGASAGSSNVTLTAGWQRFSFTVSVPALTTQLALLMTWTPTGIAGVDDAVYVTGVQIEEGISPSGFDFRLPAAELALCQRFYEKSYPQETDIQTATGAGGWNSVAINATDFYDYGRLEFKVDKRAVPAVSCWSSLDGTAMVWHDLLANANQGNVGVNNITTKGAHLYSSNNALITNKSFRTQWAADAEL